MSNNRNLYLRYYRSKKSSTQEVLVPGICGQVDGSVLPEMIAMRPVNQPGAISWHVFKNLLFPGPLDDILENKEGKAEEKSAIQNTKSS